MQVVSLRLVWLTLETWFKRKKEREGGKKGRNTDLGNQKRISKGLKFLEGEYICRRELLGKEKSLWF